MANQKQVLDVQVSKGITTAQSNEHLRDRSEKAEKYAMSKGNYDPTRKRLNFEIAPGGKIHPIDTSRSIPERMADILSHRGIKDPNEGLLEPKYRTVVNIIFGGSRKRMQELAFGTQQVDFEKVRTIPASNGSVTLNAGRRMFIHSFVADMVSRTSLHSLYIWMN